MATKSKAKTRRSRVASGVRKTARAVSATGHFCLSPLCLHVAGKAKCKRKCCKTGRRR